MAHAADVQFTLTTAYSGLYPNADVSVPVTVHNPAAYDLAVHTADVRVGDASPGCPAANLEASSYSGDVVAPPHGDAVIPSACTCSPPRPTPARARPSRSPSPPPAPRPASSPTAGRAVVGFAFTGGDSWTSAIVGAASSSPASRCSASAAGARPRSSP